MMMMMTGPAVWQDQEPAEQLMRQAPCAVSGKMILVNHLGRGGKSVLLLL